MLFFVNCLFLLILSISNGYAKEYSIENSLKKDAKGVVDQNKSKRNSKKSAEKKPDIANGYQMYNEDGEYVGVVSENQKCVFIGNYSESENKAKEYTNDIQVKKIELKCSGGSTRTYTGSNN